MIGDLKPYAAYKDSGVVWLGEVPEHWNLTSLGSLTTAISKRNKPNLPLLSVVREKGVILRSITSKEENHNFIPDDLSNYKVVRKGNLVINKMKAWQGSMGVSAFDGIVSPAYYVFDFRVENREFGHALLRSKTYVSFFAQASDGVRIGQWDLSLLGMRRIPVAVPPTEEQSAIAHFLNYADRRIRRYIRTKQKLIKLLEEQKQVVINEAVTRGLDSNVSLKSSGVKWLKDIPRHWKMKRLKHVTTPIEQGWSPQCYAWPAVEGEWGVVKVGCVNGDTFNSEENKRLPPSMSPIPALEILDQDILVSRANTRELVGLAALAINPRPRLLLCDKVFRFRTIPDQADPQFFVYAIRSRSSRAQMEVKTNGASDSMQNIGQGVVKNLLIPLPPLAEQKKIVTFLSAQMTLFNISVSKAQDEVSLLREFRTRLIADVVTGKLDVREAAAKLPAEIENSNPSDLDLAEDDIVSEDDIDLDEPLDNEAA